LISIVHGNQGDIVASLAQALRLAVKDAVVEGYVDAGEHADL
jgi:hypothetical protein